MAIPFACFSAVPLGVPVVTYPVKDACTGGWMRPTKDKALAAACAWAKRIGAPWKQLGEHEQSALGVLFHHLRLVDGGEI